MKKSKAGLQDHSSGSGKVARSGGASRSQKTNGQKISLLKKPVSITILGRPALKKNSRDIGFAGHGAKRKFIPLQSKSYRNALLTQLPQLLAKWKNRHPVGSREQPLHVEAKFYAGKGTEPDLDGAMVGLGDLLQKAGIVSNDRWIKSWDGSRVIASNQHNGEPRTELKIRAFFL